MLKILVIGCGPHATHFYLPTLRKLERTSQDVCLVGILDIIPQRQFVQEELARGNYDIQSWFVPPSPFNTLSPDIVSLLDSLVDNNIINAVIISTDPLNHKNYALWAISRNLPILLDKPVTTRRNCTFDLAAAEGIANDYEELLTAYLATGRERQPFVLCAHRRYHPGILEVRRLIREIAQKTSCPVTSIHSAHADGQWRLPHEICTQKHHSYNEGYGKISHSGFHFIDCAVEFWKEGFASGKRGDEVEVFTSFIRPDGLLKQLSRNDYARLFGEAYLEACPETDEELAQRYASCGEIDTTTTLTMKAKGVPFSLATLTLLHNSYSRRGCLQPDRDLYKGNGRVKHEEHCLNLGPFLNIQVHSYQSKDKHDICAADDEGPGGNNHFELYVFRNNRMIGGKPFERFTLRDLEGARDFSVDSLFIAQVKEKSILEWLDAIRSRNFEEKRLLSAFTDHRMSVRLMSAIYRSSCLRLAGQPPICTVPWNE